MLKTSIKYEYQCIDQKDKIVAEGEFYLNLDYGTTIRSPKVREEGYLGLINHERELFSVYRGQNHLKGVALKATNVHTKSSRYVSEREFI